MLFGNDVALLEIVHTPTSIGRKTVTLQLTSDDPAVPNYTLTLETPKLDRTITASTVPPGLPLDVTYNGGAPAPVNAGSYAVTATINHPQYQGSASGPLIVAKAAQTISFEPVLQQLTTAAINLTAGGGVSGNPVAFAVTGGPGVITNGILTFTTAGLVTVTASQAGNENFDPALSVERTLPSATATSGGGITASVRLNGATAALRGTLDANGRIQGSFPQRSGGDMVVDLQLIDTSAAGGRALRGSISWNNMAATAELIRAPFHTRNNPVPADVAATGLYTMLLPSAPGWGQDEPGGDGWATGALNAGGVVALTGQLGDGSRFTESAFLSQEGQVHLFADLYSSSPGKGRVAGRLTFRHLQDVSDFDGILQWSKGEDTRIPPRERSYPAGFRVEVRAMGSQFVPPPAGERLLEGLANAYRNAELSLIGPSAPLAASGALDRVVSWLANNQFTHHGHHKLAGSASVRNGAVKGTFVDPATRAVTAFTGAVFQRQDRVGGVFVRNNLAGAVRIVPGTFAQETSPELARVAKPTTSAGSLDATSVALTAEAAGLFHGILRNAGEATGAMETLRLTPTGGLSGTLRPRGNDRPRG